MGQGCRWPVGALHLLLPLALPSSMWGYGWAAMGTLRVKVRTCMHHPLHACTCLRIHCMLVHRYICVCDKVGASTMYNVSTIVLAAAMLQFFCMLLGGSGPFRAL